MLRTIRAFLLCGAGLVLATGAAPAPAAKRPFAALSFRSIGPTTGRIDAVAGVPGDATTYYAGGLGGLWKTTSAGDTWMPIFDHEPVSSIGAIAVAPSDHNILYVGTGEPNIRNDIAFGDGIYRSANAGKTWQHIGLRRSSQIAQIVVDPTNPNVVYVAAIGDPFAPSSQRGVFKTIDGGKTWTRVLYLDSSTGASSIAFEPGHPNTLLAGMWTVRRQPWMLTSGGANDGIYRSTDGGTTWSRVRGDGLPALMGRIGIAFAPSLPTRVYALIEAQHGVLWRSDDAGLHWHLVSDRHVLDQRPYYFSQLAVDPRNAERVYFMSIFASLTKNAGKTLSRIDTGGYDHHQIWIDPTDPQRMIIGADAGVRISQDGGKTWIDPQLIVSQPYHISVDNETPYFVCGEFQDPGAACGPSLSFTGAITPDRWFSPQMGESGWIVFSPANQNEIYGTGYEENIESFNRTTGEARTISPWPDDYIGEGANRYKYRAAWVAPLAVSSLQPHALFYGAQMVLKSVDDGATWHAISPDLTRNDPRKQHASGRPITRDNAGTEVYDTIASIAASPRAKGELWVGTDDGRVWLTRDGGKGWVNLTKHVPGLPKWARVNYVDPSPFDPATAYLVANNAKLGDRSPYLYVTHDYGARWYSIAANLPRNSYARMIREDPVRKGLLYVGTETGLWYSEDDGAHWETLRNNLAHLPIYDFVVQKAFDDLVVATHGRGVWILDDLSPLQDLTPKVAMRASYLFPVRKAYRWEATFATWATGAGAGANPPAPADINVYLRDVPAKNVHPQIAIYDGTHLIRRLPILHPVVGVNRVWWDLGVQPVPHIAAYHATQTGFIGPTVVPGTYTVELTGLGAPQRREIHVLQDPKSDATIAEMRAQYALAMQLRAAYRRVGNEVVQLRRLQTRLERSGKKADLAKVNAALSVLYQANTQSWEDTLRVPERLYERIYNLGQEVQSGDYAPTRGEVLLARDLEGKVNAAMRADNALMRSASTRA